MVNDHGQIVFCPRSNLGVMFLNQATSTRMRILVPRIPLILLNAHLVLDLPLSQIGKSRDHGCDGTHEMLKLIQSRPVFGIIWLALGLSLSLSQGCARSEPHAAVPSDPNSLDANSIEATSPDTSTRITSALPFASHAHILPSGTLLTVQLDNSLSTAKVRDGDTFTASVAAPLTVDGDPLIERGAVATGHVESVRAQAGSGYFQLRLSALTVEGRQLALQTTSLFTRGTSGQPDEVRVQKGRHLTFRLTSPLTLNEPKSIAATE
jgi:hypothetical protein